MLCGVFKWLLIVGFLLWQLQECESTVSQRKFEPPVAEEKMSAVVEEPCFGGCDEDDEDKPDGGQTLEEIEAEGEDEDDWEFGRTYVLLNLTRG